MPPTWLLSTQVWLKAGTFIRLTQETLRYKVSAAYFPISLRRIPFCNTGMTLNGSSHKVSADRVRS